MGQHRTQGGEGSGTAQDTRGRGAVGQHKTQGGEGQWDSTRHKGERGSGTAQDTRGRGTENIETSLG